MFVIPKPLEMGALEKLLMDFGLAEDLSPAQDSSTAIDLPAAVDLPMAAIPPAMPAIALSGD